MSTTTLYGGAAHRRVTIVDLKAAKVAGEKWAALTSYEQMTAEIFDQAGIPVLLVGDSAGNNFLGGENTIAVTVDELMPLTRAVVRASKRAMVIADLPLVLTKIHPSKPWLLQLASLKRPGRWP
jgi:3-methyl-2-oxobutanoate hydroxymethyltransferase